MKYLLTIFLSLAIASEAQKVYICTGASSKRYHKTRNCNGLRNCGGQIKEVTLEHAREIGRTPCKVCYGK